MLTTNARSVEFEGPLYDTWPPATHRNIFPDDTQDAKKVIREFASRAFRRPITPQEEVSLFSVFEKATKMSDGQIRFIGLTSMVIGLLLLFVWR